MFSLFVVKYVSSDLSCWEIIKYGYSWKTKKTANFALSVSVVSDQMSGCLPKLKYERKWINGIMKWISCDIRGSSDIRDINKCGKFIVFHVL